MELAQVVSLADRNVQDIPNAMRTLADQIEKGECGPVRAVVLVLDIKDEPAEIGWFGAAAEIKPAAHLLLAKGMRALEL